MEQIGLRQQDNTVGTTVQIEDLEDSALADRFRLRLDFFPHANFGHSPLEQSKTNRMSQQKPAQQAKGLRGGTSKGGRSQTVPPARPQMWSAFRLF